MNRNPALSVSKICPGTYVNSLSLQAVLEKCATTAEKTAAANAGGPAGAAGSVAPALLSSKLVAFRKQNAIYLGEVVDASRSMLRHILDGLVPQNGLRHAPVRTYFRILSGAMFLLKVSVKLRTASADVTHPEQAKQFLLFCPFFRLYKTATPSFCSISLPML